MSTYKLTPEEAFVEKRFKRDGFKVIKLDVTNEYKAPDFKLVKSNFSALVEVKVGFKKGKVLKILEHGAQQFDPSFAVNDYFGNCILKRKEYIKHNRSDSKLPFFVVFIMPFFISDELVWEEAHYKKYKDITAVFVPKRSHPLDSKVNDFTPDELERIINDNKFESATRLGWSIIINPYASNRFKKEEISSIFEVFTAGR